MMNLESWMSTAFMLIVLALYIFWAGKRQRQCNEASRLSLQAAKENSEALKRLTEAVISLQAAFEAKQER